MPDEPRDRTVFPPDTAPHAVEVSDAQAANDEAGTRRRSPPPPGRDPAADLTRLRDLVAAYGAVGVRRMIDAME